MAKFKPLIRKNKSELNELPIVEGQFILLESDEEIYIDSSPLKRQKVAGKDVCAGLQKYERIEVVAGVAIIDLNIIDVSIFIIDDLTVNTIRILRAGVPENHFRTFELHLKTNGIGTITWFNNINWIGGNAPALESGKTNVITIRTDDRFVNTGQEMALSYVGNLAYTY